MVAVPTDMARPSHIHSGLVGERALVGTPYLADAGLRREYADEIAPRTTVALAKILSGVWPAGRGVRRALDLGAGTGAAGAALRAHFGGKLAVVAVDRVQGSEVDVVADLAVVGARPAGVAGRFDLVVAAHLLNELPLDTERRARLVRAWAAELLEPDGSLVIVEPALRETSRALLAVRDRVIEAGLFVVAPCLWQGPCPARQRERDWCHDAAPVEVAPRVDFSYLVLRTRGEAASDPGLFRVVSDPLHEKGRRRLYGCGPAGRHAIVLLRKHRTPENAPFETLERGDLARIARTGFARDGLRLGPESAVEGLAPRSMRPRAGR